MRNGYKLGSYTCFTVSPRRDCVFVTFDLEVSRIDSSSFHEKWFDLLCIYVSM